MMHIQIFFLVVDNSCHQSHLLILCVVTLLFWISLTDNVALSLPVKTPATYVLRRYGSESDFTCVNSLDWGFNFPTKIIVNIFFNNKQRLSRDIVRKESVTGFKKRQRTR